jgi:aminoglycoside phosphotransferase (APT) family kinase protein
MDTATLSEITNRFGAGRCLEAEPVREGKVNATFRITTGSGTFILQRLKPPLNEKTILDGLALTEHLISKGFPAPRFQVSPTGEPFVKNGDEVYRMMTLLPGRTLDAMRDANVSYAAGILVGRLHRALADFHYAPVFKFEGLHDTAYALGRLRNLVLSYPEKAEQVKPMVERLAEEIPRLVLPAGLPRRCIHGDLKYTNILFDDSGRAVGLLDFDTIMISTLPMEMGDAFRSWCTRKYSPQGGRDSGAGGRPFFDESIFRAGWQGYLSRRPPVIAEEKAWIVSGIKTVLLELGCRYLIDYFENRYFAWDRERFPDRPAHNLFRAGRQLTVFDDVAAKEDRLRSLLEAD